MEAASSSIGVPEVGARPHHSEATMSPHGRTTGGLEDCGLEIEQATACPLAHWI